MHVAGVREFRNRAPKLLGGNEVVFVTRHGKLASIVVPMKNPQALPIEMRKELLTRLGVALASHLQHHGLTEARIQDDFVAWRKKRRARRR